MMKYLFFIMAIVMVFFGIGCTAGPKNVNFTGYAIVYGISTYIDSLPEGSYPNLTLPDDDAVSMAALLEEKGYTIISDGPRLDSEATKANLLADVAETAALADENSTVVFYFAGHGVQSYIFSDLSSSGEESTESGTYDSYDEWIMLYDSVHSDGLNLSFTSEDAVYDDELNTILSDINTYKKIVLIDACNSGGFIGEGYVYDSIPQDVDGWVVINGPFSSSLTLYFKASDEEDSVDIPPFQAFVFTAAGEQESSFEDDSYGHGIFTYYLLESGASGDTNGDGYTTVSEAFIYVSEMIVTEWNDTEPSYNWFHPHTSGTGVDIILFPDG